MSNYQFANLDIQSFLTNHWQKKPTLIKGAFKDFIDPIDANELAGLALEEEVDSRVIVRNGDQWHVEHGPFEDFGEFGEKDWTLLVQAVDHWMDEGNNLITPFRFIPNWRIDDLMVSFSTPGGGVGPHLDQYDVFIIQGQGKRHWRVGERQDVESVVPHPDLLQVKEFESVIDAILEPGDMLYIPPGCPHEGYATEAALNYSIGFRAPNQQDLLSAFADYALAEECFSERYSDADLVLPKDQAKITAVESSKLKHLMLDALNQEQKFNDWLGKHLSEAKRDLDIQAPEPAYQVEDIQCMLDEVVNWQRLGGLRVIEVAEQIYINGELWSKSEQNSQILQLIGNNAHYTSDQLSLLVTKVEELNCLTKLVNEGFIYALD